MTYADVLFAKRTSKHSVPIPDYSQSADGKSLSGYNQPMSRVHAGSSQTLMSRTGPNL